MTEICDPCVNIFCGMGSKTLRNARFTKLVVANLRLTRAKLANARKTFFIVTLANTWITLKIVLKLADEVHGVDSLTVGDADVGLHCLIFLCGIAGE